MLIAIYPNTLINAVWMQHNIGNFIIHLLPSISSTINYYDILLFWNSTYNYIGLSLVDMDQLFKVIDFLFIDYGGMCNKFKRADKIIVPQNIKDMAFSIYNAFCPQTPHIVTTIDAKKLFVSQY